MKLSRNKRLLAISVSILLFLYLIGTGRNVLIRQYVNHKLKVLTEQRQLSIHYDDIRMEGLNTLCIDGLSVVPHKADTFLSADNFQVRLNLKRLLLLEPTIENITSKNLQVHFIKKDSLSNFDFLYRSSQKEKEESAETEVSERNYARQTERTLNLLFKLLPENASIHDLCVYYSNKGDELKIEIPSLIVSDNQFSTNIKSTENDQVSEWVCEGSLKDHLHQIQASLYAHGDTKIALPFLEYRYGAALQFDTLSFELQGLKEEIDLQTLCGKAHISGLTLHHRRISPDTVLLDRGTFAYNIRIGKNFLELDSTSQVHFNQLEFHPYLRAEKDSAWHLTASVNKKNFPADDLFSSLPKGLFYNLEGLKAEGTLSYHFLVDLDFAKVDSLIFESTIQSRNFRILSYGNTDLRKMNDPFIYTAYENGEPVRTFEVGPGYAGFRPYQSISRYLPLAIMQSEDAGFFVHAGFIPSAIRESLILDIKERRFARGGSTISMQLVKNVFLSRHKTIARKLEEILIVWLVEGNRLTSKERMFEVYLNIAEWGPMIYGAAEASHFYFAKEPSELTLGECIFLGSIIPKPKHVKYCFDGLQLKPNYEEFFPIILNRLIDRGLIAPEEAEGVTPASVKITGPAKAYLTGSTTKDLYLPEPSPEDLPEED